MPITLTHGGALSNLPLFLALDRDLFADVGLDAEAPPLVAFGSTVAQLRDGTAALGTAGFTQALADAGSPDPLVIVAGSGLRGMALVGRAGSEPAALDGAVVGTFADDPMRVLLADVLARHDLESRVVIRPMPSLAEAARQLRAGSVAAITTVEPWIARLKGEGATVLSDGTDVWGSSYPDTVLLARRSRLQRDPGMVVSVIRAMLRAERAIAADPRGCLAAVARRFPGFSVDDLEAGLAGQPPCVDLRGAESAITGRWAVVRRLQGLPAGPVPAGLIDFRCLEAALAAEADDPLTPNPIRKDADPCLTALQA